jgi:dTDP-4-dehydrorhamnose reductase
LGVDLGKVLILGSSGLLGSKISQILGSKFEVIGTHYSNAHNSVRNSIHLDISSQDLFEEIVKKVSPQFVVNCVGLTSVDDCERLPEKAMLLNALFPHRVAKASSKFKFRFLHVSTDHYGTTSSEVRNELMDPIPVNSYGYSKLTGERLVLNESPAALILRTNFFGVSASGNHSILDFAVNSLNGASPVYGYEDVWFSPLGVTQIGRFLEKALEGDLAGVLNLTGTESITKLDFLRAVAVALEFNPNRVIPAKSSNFSSLVSRPTNLSLDNSKLRSLGVKLPTLRDMIEEELSYRVGA